MDHNHHFNQGYIPPYPNQHGPPPPPGPQSGIGTFGSLSAQGHQQDSPSHATLPPLQGNNAGYHFGNMHYGHSGSQAPTPTTPHTPATSSMQNASANAFSHMSPAAQQQSGSMMPPSFGQSYSVMSQSMPYSSATSTSMPATSSAGGLAAIRPMPPGGLNTNANGLPSLTGAPQMGQQNAFMQNEEAPTHVVGSQGRRGILPSAPGRPNPPAQGSTQANKSMIPQKDADGKFPCPHCNKTYLHAKHLKRHLLRHTGDRPYMCHLCKDTFSRSDILKRHFQKCSIRRGNPTGANHLAHQRRNTNSGNRLSISQQDGPIGLAGLQDVAGTSYNGGITQSPTVNGDVSGRNSRANSIISPATMSHRNSIAGLGILGSNGHEQMGSSAGFQPGMSAYAMPHATSGGSMQPNYAYNNPPMNGNVFNNQQQSQPMSFLGQQSSRFSNNQSNGAHQQNVNGDASGNQFDDWSRAFSQRGQDGFIGSQPVNASSQTMNNIKTESDTMQNDMSNESFLGNLYSHPGAFGSEYGESDGGIPGFPNWSLDDPLQAKVDSLLHYVCSGGMDTMHGNALELVKSCLTVENVRHLAEQYTSWHGHWPILHMPTFKLTSANDGLVLAILCIGAIYSPKLNMDQTRQMMEFVKARVMSSSSIYGRTVNSQFDGLGTQPWEIEEFQALLMVQCMFTWHGEPHHRQAARNEFPTLARIAKAMGLCTSCPPGHYAYSIFHSGQGSSLAKNEVNSWNWHSWLEQEKRNRALYLLFLTDAAMSMYFNALPQLDPFEIRLMLPSDDAAWDASDSAECASALGLFGPQAQSKNRTGTRNVRQPSMRDAMRMLLEPNAMFAPGSTNAYAKFVLIHAIIIRIIACQKALLTPDAMLQGFSSALSGSTPATPLSQNDWLEHRSGSGGMSASSSGHVTPTDSYAQGGQNPAAQQEKKRLSYALDKWKKLWDQDMDLQYPAGQTQLRRFGFSRDGVHFFFLGRSFLQSQRAADWTASADVRFKQVMALLKRIKQYVVSDNEMKGQEIGSIGDIDDQYGLDSLTLDMKLLFKPYDSQVDNPVAGVQTHSL